jgi:GNAT superfamily N-acetyltransferase
MQVNIRRLSPESTKDIDGWRELYQTVFGREYPEEVWKWKYLENPYNDSEGPLIYLAESNTRIAGARSLLPSMVTIEDGQTREVLRVCQNCNMMVHPDFRRQGLFTKTANHADEDARGKGYKLVYGYPNAQSLAGDIKMGHAYLGQLRYCAVAVEPERILGDYFTGRGIPRLARKAFLPVAGATVRLLSPRITLGQYRLEHGPVDRFVQDIANLHQCAGPRQGIFGLRSVEFLSWRFRRPGRDYWAYALYDSDRMAGYLVVFIDTAARRALIKDIYAPGLDHEILARLLKGTRDHLKTQSYGLLSISLLDREWPLKSLFSPRHGVWRRYVAEYLTVHPLSKELRPGLLSDRNNWYLQQVDRSPF